MTTVDDILKEATDKSNALSSLLEKSDSPAANTAYQRKQTSRIAAYDALLAGLRGSAEEPSVMEKPLPPLPSTPSPFFPKPAVRRDVRFDALRVPFEQLRPGILVPSPVAKKETPATMPQAFDPAGSQPSPLRKPVRMPR